jgi:hypothetical protein
MSIERKRHFIGELKRHYSEIIKGANEAEVDTAEAAGVLQSEARSREDAKGAAELGCLSSAHRGRRERAKREVDGPAALRSVGAPVASPFHHRLSRIPCRCLG